MALDNSVVQGFTSLPLQTMGLDSELLAKLGYKQELRRHFSWVELLGLSLSIIGVVQSIASVLIYTIPNGGAVAMVWGWTACCFPLMMMALSMAELASSAPTSGGLYYWSFKFSSDRYQKLLSWIVGYSNFIGLTAGFASGAYAASLQIFAAATIASGGVFVPTSGQIFGLFIGLVIFHTIIASLATKLLARLQTPFMFLSMLLFLALVVALPTATPSGFKNSARYVFGNFENLTLWPGGFAFLLSFLGPTWTMSVIDCAVHISEEARNASFAVPFTIIMSTALGCIIGWVFNVAVAFHMGTDMLSIVSNPIGQPMATILLNAFGQKGTLAAWSCIIAIMNMSVIDVLLTASRQTFAFSRDGGLPFSKQLYTINKWTGTPVNCVFACAFVAIILVMLSFVGSVAIGSVFTMGVVCQYIAYSIPILARHLGGKEFHPGPFNLGKWSIPVAFNAVGFMALMIVVMLFPSNPNVTAATMNFTVVVVGAALLFSIVYYFFPKYGGRYWFTGPVRTVVDQDDGHSNDLKDEGT